MEKLISRVTGFVVLLVFGIVLSVPFDAGAGEKEHRGRYVNAKAEFKLVKVGDVDGHVVGPIPSNGCELYR